LALQEHRKLQAKGRLRAGALWHDQAVEAPLPSAPEWQAAAHPATAQACYLSTASDPPCGRSRNRLAMQPATLNSNARSKYIGGYLVISDIYSLFLQVLAFPRRPRHCLRSQPSAGL